jgi:hypothetical protein
MNKPLWLHALIAQITDTKKRAEGIKKSVYQKLQKATLFVATLKEYTPLVEGGIQYTSEGTSIVPESVPLLLDEFNEAVSKLLNEMATQDWGNTKAKADVIIDDIVIVKDAPVTFLMALQSQLIDYRTLFDHVPTLSPVDKWEYNAGQMVWSTPATITNKEQVIKEWVPIFQPTEHHPGEAKEVSRTKLEGTWESRKFSTALLPSHRKELLQRVDRLIEAVKVAREEANRIQVEPKDVATSIIGYLMGA